MRPMSSDEWITFANHSTRTGNLATTRPDGRPHVAPVWFLVDEDGAHLWFTTPSDSVKGRALRRDPRFALSVDDQQPPYSFVLIEAEAELREDPAEMLGWATRLGVRYMGDGAGAQFGERNAVPGEYLVRGRITTVVARADIAG